MKQQEQQTQEARFTQLARRIRRKRLLVAAVIIFLAAVTAIGAFNYYQAGWQARPSIAFSVSREGDGVTSIETAWSLGFKQVCYQSKYGKNYSQRLWPWEAVQKESPSLTIEQYRGICHQLERSMEQQTQADDYFQVFSCFEASIMDIEKKGKEYTIYMRGGLFSFIEYDGNVYQVQLPESKGWRIDSASEEDQEQAQSPIIVTAVLDAGEMKVTDLQKFQSGTSGAAAVWEHFSEPVARRLVSTVSGFSDTGQGAETRAYFKAAAHFGAEYEEEKRLECDLKEKTIKVYQAKYSPRVKGAEEAGEQLVKQDRLKKRKA